MPKFRRKRLVALLAGAAALAVLALAACSGPVPRPDDGRKKVLTTFTVIADMTREVAGDRLDVESITKFGAEIHEYEPTPADLVRAEGADLVLDNGLGLERWFRRFVERAELPSVAVSTGVQPIAISVGSYQGQANPHAWMSPRVGVLYVANIRDALSRLDPANAAYYRDNAQRYTTRLHAVEQDLVRELAVLPATQRALVSCEGAFSYLARDTGLREGYLWPVNNEAEGTPGQIAAMVRFVRDNQVPAVFCESTVNGSAQRQVAAETGARVGPTLYVDSLSEAGGPVPTYLDLLRHDTRSIVAGLTGRAP